VTLPPTEPALALLQTHTVNPSLGVLERNPAATDSGQARVLEQTGSVWNRSSAARLHSEILAVTKCGSLVSICLVNTPSHFLFAAFLLFILI